MRLLTNEKVKIAGSIQIEEKVVLLHALNQKKGVSGTEEVTKIGGRIKNK
jgi:hypothetical protein